MANIVVTTTATAINVAFNDLSDEVGIVEGTWSKSSIISVELHAGTHVHVDMIRASDWKLSYDGVNGLQVDSVNGVPPVSNQALYDALKLFI